MSEPTPGERMSLTKLADFKSPDVQKASKDHKAVGVVPLGATEQHGPHLPLGTDTFILERLLNDVGQSIGSQLVATPTVPVGYSPYHKAFPGTISTAMHDYVTLIEAHIDALALAGFSRIAVVSHHGGNFQPLHEACVNAGERLPSHTVAGYSDLGRYLSVELAAARGSGVNVGDSDVHAGAVETSLMMHLTGAPTSEEVAEIRGFTGPIYDKWIDHIMADGIESLSPVGVLGDPRIATSSLGQAVFTAMVDELVAWFTKTFDAAAQKREAASVS